MELASRSLCPRQRVSLSASLSTALFQLIREDVWTANSETVKAPISPKLPRMRYATDSSRCSPVKSKFIAIPLPRNLIFAGPDGSLLSRQNRAINRPYLATYSASILDHQLVRHTSLLILQYSTVVITQDQDSYVFKSTRLPDGNPRVTRRDQSVYETDFELGTPYQRSSRYS